MSRRYARGRVPIPSARVLRRRGDLAPESKTSCRRRPGTVLVYLEPGDVRQVDHLSRPNHRVSVVPRSASADDPFPRQKMPSGGQPIGSRRPCRRALETTAVISASRKSMPITLLVDDVDGLHDRQNPLLPVDPHGRRFTLCGPGPGPELPVAGISEAGIIRTPFRSTRRRRGADRGIGTSGIARFISAIPSGAAIKEFSFNRGTPAALMISGSRGRRNCPWRASGRPKGPV